MAGLSGKFCGSPLQQTAETTMTPLLSDISCNHHFLERRECPLGRASRGLLVTWSLFLLTGFSLAVWLEPDPRGFGTHQKLGLPECGIRAMFGTPCPSCGMTTSFAHFVRGHWIRAAESNLAGLALALICTIQIPWCWWSAYRGSLWKVTNPEVALLWLLLPLMGLGIVHWALRLIFI